jgi:hypothetical protein
MDSEPKLGEKVGENVPIVTSWETEADLLTVGRDRVADILLDTVNVRVLDARVGLLAPVFVPVTDLVPKVLDGEDVKDSVLDGDHVPVCSTEGLCEAVTVESTLKLKLKVLVNETSIVGVTVVVSLSVAVIVRARVSDGDTVAVLVLVPRRLSDAVVESEKEPVEVTELVAVKVDVRNCDKVELWLPEGVDERDLSREIDHDSDGEEVLECDEDLCAVNV